MVAEAPEITWLRAGSAPRFLQRLVEVERLLALALLPNLQAPEQVAHLVLIEAREREVQVGYGLQLRQ